MIDVSIFSLVGEDHNIYSKSELLNLQHCYTRLLKPALTQEDEDTLQELVEEWKHEMENYSYDMLMEKCESWLRDHGYEVIEDNPARIYVY